MKTFIRLIVSMVYLCIMDMRRRIITASTRLFMKYGIKSISMDDISRELGISKKTLYQFINNKEDLVDAGLEIYLKENQENIEESILEAEDAIDELVKISQQVMKHLVHISPSTIFDLKKYHPQSWKKLETFQFSYVENTIFDNLKRGQSEGLYRNNLMPKIISRLYVYKANAIANPNVFPISQFDRITLFKEIVKYHLFGIVSEKGLKNIYDHHKNFLLT